MEFKLEAEPILEDELYSTPPLMRVVVAKMTGTKRDIPKVFSLTRDDVSTIDLKHLRRIKDLPDGGMDCIVAKLPNLEKYDDSVEIEKLKELKDKYINENIFTDYRIVLVPSEAPRTNHQWKACSSMWPCKFAKSNYLIQCIEGSIFDDAERLVLHIVVNNLIKHIQKNQDRYSSGAIVFRYAKIYGIGLSSCELLSRNPMKHPAMLAIDSVAKEVGSGHWSDSNYDECRDLIQSIQLNLDKQAKLGSHKMESNFLPYLCTNYDIFLTEEPCIMCTMGLVQSRIRRLFYLGQKGKSLCVTGLKKVCYPDSAVESFLVHRDKNLNHRFEAWRINLS